MDITKPKKISRLKALPGWVLYPVGIFIFFVGMFSGTFLPVKFGGLKQIDNNNALPKDLNYSSVEEVFDTLRQSYDGQLDSTLLLEGLKKGLAQATGDNYTEFFSADEAEDLNSDINGKFGGIGAELDQDADKNLIILSALDDSPAQKAGIRPKDIIAKIDGETTANLTINQSINKIRGDAGTDVKLTLIRDGKVIEVTITRDDIVLQNVRSEMLEDNVGYIRIVRFSNDSADLTIKAAKDLKAKNAKTIILDLRSNPGGYLDASVKIAGLWLSDKVVLEEKRDDRVIKSYNSNAGENILSNMKTVVLIDEGSASASEILAGALRDHNVATLVGVKTFGKGSVQTIANFDDGSALKVTIARWYTPNGLNIDKQGISPDIEVKLTDEDIDKKNDAQKTKALDLLK